MTRYFYTYIVHELQQVYSKHEVKPILLKDTLEYKMDSDGDYATDHEYARFTMSDGNSYQAFYWHKEFQSFEQIL